MNRYNVRSYSTKVIGMLVGMIRERIVWYTMVDSLAEFNELADIKNMLNAVCHIHILLKIFLNAYKRIN